jgi:hypothetical protein
MKSYRLLPELCESRLIPSRTALAKWDQPRLRKVSFLYFLSLRMLLAGATTKTWAEHYCDKAVRDGHFAAWRGDGNDLYVMIHALTNDGDDKLSVPAVRDWLRHAASKQLDQYTQHLFNRLDGMFHVTDASLKSLRRRIMYWDAASKREQGEAVDTMVQRLQSLAPHSELLDKLKSLSPAFNDDLQEAATAGATGAASLATVPGTLGAGFGDAEEAWRSIYPTVVRRPPPSKAANKPKK